MIATEAVRPTYPKSSTVAVEALPEFSARDLIDSSNEKSGFTEMPQPNYWLSRLYAPGELIRVGSGDLFKTDTVKDLWRELPQYSLMCPNPFAERRDERPAFRKYLVITFPQNLALNKQARRIHGLDDGRLACVVFDGRSQLHAWYNVEGSSPSEQAAFFDRAVALSAENTWQLNGLTRTPDALRLTSTREAFCRLKAAGIRELLALGGLKLCYSRRQLVMFFREVTATSSGNGDLPLVPEKGRSA